MKRKQYFMNIQLPIYNQTQVKRMKQHKQSQGQYTQQQMKVLLFQFSDQKWNQVRIAILQIILQKSIINLKIINHNDPQPKQIPSFLSQHNQPNQETISIPLKTITNIEVEEADQKILYLWLGTNPISISFKDLIYAKEITIIVNEFMKQKQQKQTQHLSNGINGYDEINFVIQNMKNGSFQELYTLFTNIDLLEKVLDFLIELPPQSQCKQAYFIFAKNFILISNQKIIETLIKDKYFQFILSCLRLNPFNDRDFDYNQQYKNIIKMQNVLEINDEAIMQAYLDNAKLKFLKDFAACVFIQFDTIKVFQDIICLNNVIILQKIGTSACLMKQMVKLSKQDPFQYLNIFSQLWEIFKSTSFDLQFKDIKEYFKKEFVSNCLDSLALNSLSQVLNFQVKPYPRFIQKVLQAFTSFLNHDWMYSQNWILSQQPKHSLGNILLKTLSYYDDQSLKLSVLHFVRKIIEPNQGRQQPSSRFVQCIFNYPISKLHQYYMKKTNQIEHYVQFMIKVYKFETIRIRRVLVQNEIIMKICEKKYNKYILICILKMFQIFIETGDKHMIMYLKYHNCFQGLMQEYIRNKYSQNITNACFLNLMKTIYTNKDKYENIDISLGFEEEEKKQAYTA